MPSSGFIVKVIPSRSIPDLDAYFSTSWQNGHPLEKRIKKGCFFLFSR
ncbi:hypothetical protein PROFUN_03908 [Planoprotostelium fungivorum]|uniref:Uncharacterized protein n=1 Tax=Planoprotostelium fungivorum TaxID=1890364 RepID=A0A2P6MTN2_9EUKA|nr:hypothetical protein PROFUN_03908 [Planoprotostelium fungivorum]